VTTPLETYHRGHANGAGHVNAFYCQGTRNNLWLALFDFRSATQRPGHDATIEAARLALVVAEAIDTLDAADAYAWARRKDLLCGPFPAETAPVGPTPGQPSRPFSTSTKGE
jgi:hypothetical protein